MAGTLDTDIRPMTVDEFYAFTDTRPDDEKWELIGGKPILNAAPSPLHQLIVGNVIGALWLRKRGRNLPWSVLPGFGVRVSDRDRPQPDVLVVPAGRGSFNNSRNRNDAVVAFEVLSPSTEKRDLGWKRAAYPRLPLLTHYIAISQDSVDVLVFARDNDFAERRVRRLDKMIDLRSLGVSLPMSEIYRDTGLTA